MWPAAPPPPAPAPPGPPTLPEPPKAPWSRRVWRFAWRNRHATIPLTVPVGMLAAGAAVAGWHPPLRLFGVATVAWPVALAGIASIAMWYGAPKRWSRTRRLPPGKPEEKRWLGTSEVAYARASVIALSLWLCLVAYMGDTDPLALIGAAGTVAWGVPFWWHKRPRGRRAHKKEARARAEQDAEAAARTAAWDRWWQSFARAWGLAGSYVCGFYQQTDVVDVIVVQLRRGFHTFEQVRSIRANIESALAGHVKHIRIQLNQDDKSQVLIFLSRENPLREVVAWDDSMAATDITQPATIGFRETGKRLMTVLLKNLFVIGATQTGKTSFYSVLFATVTACRNARLWLIDNKGDRSLWAWFLAADWAAAGLAEAKLMRECMAAEITARGRYAYDGGGKLTPSVDIPAIIGATDECHKIDSDHADKRFSCQVLASEISREGSEVAVHLWESTQYGRLDQSVGLATTRAQLTGRACFRMEEAEHGSFALGEKNADCDPTTLTEDGSYFWREKSKTLAEKVRGPYIDHPRARKLGARNARATGLRDRPLRLFCGNQPSTVPGLTWQEVYDLRWDRFPLDLYDRIVALVQRELGPDVPLPPRPLPQRWEQAIGAKENKINMEDRRRDDPEVLRIVAEQEDAIADTPDDVDERVILRNPDLVRLGERVVEGAVRFASDLDAAPAEGIGVNTLCESCGLGRTWVSTRLKALVSMGAVVGLGNGGGAPYRGNGRTWPALEQILAGDRQRAREAREALGRGEQ
jgi:hypothetical protein